MMRSPRMSYIFFEDSLRRRVLRKKRGKLNESSTVPSSSLIRGRKTEIQECSGLDLLPTPGAKTCSELNGFSVTVPPSSLLQTRSNEIKPKEIFQLNVSSPTFPSSSSLQTFDADIHTYAGTELFPALEENICSELEELDVDQCSNIRNIMWPQLIDTVESHDITESEVEHFENSSNNMFETHGESADSDVYHPSLNVRKSEVLFMVMNIFMNHHLSNSALEDILKMLNIITGYDNLPKTFTKFSAYFSKHTLSRHYYCETCVTYIGTNARCLKCDKDISEFFVTFDIVPNLTDILIKHWESYETFSATNMTGRVIEERKRVDTNLITLSFNTDGVKVYNSSAKKSLWPILLSINELPPSLRFSKNNIIVAGLWMGSKDPDFNIFLKPLSDALKEFNSTGITLNKRRISAIYITACCVDTVARCKLQNFKQFNGYDACGYCSHPGNIIGKQASIETTIGRRRTTREVAKFGNESSGGIQTASDVGQRRAAVQMAATNGSAQHEVQNASSTVSTTGKF
ncbi:uncharacterized protein LOC129752217 [Uranotaenia lowii]|uniref:uncharacterized protein LOC129752217 n=1 Tax=Uranotaenia lowii TaxID=190385 RepID=UPI00247A92EE|nr:uncharacterized protein LOC129752217 [Uranotaenia lowii]